MLIAAFLASYVAMILMWEDFAYYDNDLLMLYTLKGQNYPPPVWMDLGRFFPFGLLEFNLIRHFTNTAVGYQLFPCVQVLIFFSILLLLDADLSITARLGLAVLTLLSPSVFLSFGALIFEERNVLFFLVCLVLFLQQFEKTKKVGWAIAAVICAQIMIYYKETAFLLLLGLAGGRLILRTRSTAEARWHLERLCKSENRLDLCLATLAASFLLTYFVVMGSHHLNFNYATMARHRLAEVVVGYLRVDLLAWLFMVAVLSRIYLILTRRTTPWLLWDSLALGGLLCFLAYISLRMVTAYYLAAVDLIAVLYLGRLVLLSWKNTQYWSKAAILILALAVIFQDISLSGLAAFERKNDIRAKVEIASVIEGIYRNGAEGLPTLFFPFANPYSIMEFVVYLDYRGVPIAKVELINKTAGRDDRCVAYRNIRCDSATAPAPGDLVVVLPDDEAPLKDTLVYRQHGQLVVSYRPRPVIPHWSYWFVGGFPLAAGDYNQPRPDRWMDASVTVWK